MDFLLAKIVLFFASILSIITGPNYIKIGADNLTFDFRSSEIFPIYYFLNVQNVGPGEERFEFLSDQPWVAVYRESTSFTFVELPSQAYINFVLEVHPERLPDGVNTAKVFIKVLDIESLVSQEVVLDKAEISVKVNKNLEPTPQAIFPISPAASPVFIPSPEPVVTSTPIPISTQILTLTPSPVKNPSLLPKRTLIKTPSRTPSQIIYPTPSFSFPAVPLYSQEETTPEPKSVFDSIWLFLKRIFIRIFIRI